MAKTIGDFNLPQCIIDGKCTVLFWASESLSNNVQNSLLDLELRPGYMALLLGHRQRELKYSFLTEISKITSSRSGLLSKIGYSYTDDKIVFYRLQQNFGRIRI
jgi:hypothetical protein